MKKNSLYAGRFALSGVAFAAMTLLVPDAWALGLGRLAVQSALGETLRAEIDVTSLTPEEASNLRIRVAPPESYRAAGVDYNAVLPGTQAVLQRRADGRPYLRLTSDRAVQEPFVDVILEISWATGRLVREYTLLFDPPSNNRALAQSTEPATTVAPRISPAASEPPAAPVAPPPPRVVERRAPTAAAPAAPAPTTPAPAAPAPEVRKAATAAAPAGGAEVDEYRVRTGDTLTRIAGRTQRPGVSLDQMLVSLYQANPQAFIENNMNRLRAGVVLSVPSADVAKALAPAEARQFIQAQSADFGAYRQRLAGIVPAARTDVPARQASGKVEAAVEDRKQAAAPAPDKLTLSKGTGAQASAPEDRLSKEREKADAATRVAELSKNVDELKKLSGAAAASVPAKTSPVPAVPAPAPSVEPPAPAPVVVATAPPVAPPPPVPAPMTPPPAPAPVRPPVASASAPVPEQPGMIAGMLEDNPLALAAGGALLALLAGFGIYRFTKRSKKDSGETSFLESRLQPDSFFGASGGQRIDTRDAGGASSSMSYSLSQLDAIGDVDPVAEADVYLAYGRDLQAEEILKEAMRATPDRLAIRTKLLEVYAKRRDTKGFELLATQLFGLTGGAGEDWAKAQEIGRQIDPDHPLYQPGGAPPNVEGDGARPSAELLGASTMPQSVLPAPSEFSVADDASGGFEVPSDSGLDLDLDLDPGDPAPSASLQSPEVTQPLRPGTNAPEVDAMNFDLPLEAPASSFAPAPPVSAPMDFDLSGISLDLGETIVAAPVAAPAQAADEFATIDLDEASPDGADPIVRKLELAEEFRQIGDMEGARDLLQEVVAKSSGAVRSRAQTMLDGLG